MEGQRDELPESPSRRTLPSTRQFLRLLTVFLFIIIIRLPSLLCLIQKSRQDEHRDVVGVNCSCLFGMLLDLYK